MAKVYGSPLGSIRGKVGSVVGGSWRGIDWIKGFKKCIQRGTLDNFWKYKEGQIPLSEFSYKQMNLRHVIMNVLGTIAREKLVTWMHTVWNTLTVDRNWRMSGINAFLKANTRQLLLSMPDYSKEYDESTNAPDLLKMLVSDGDLEGADIVTATHSIGTGETVITWDTSCYDNGLPTDKVYVMCAQKPIMDINTWTPTLKMYGPISQPEVVRNTGTITFTLPKDIPPSNLVAYLFFSIQLIETQDKNQDFSTSRSKQCL